MSNCVFFLFFFYFDAHVVFNLFILVWWGFFCAPVHKLFWTLKVFFFSLFLKKKKNSFYLKNILFSLFYSGPFDYVKFDVVGLKDSLYLHTLGKNVGKLIHHFCFNLISRLAIEFDVPIFFFLLNCGAGGMLSDVSLFYLIFVNRGK